jgi:hypothetical protein
MINPRASVPDYLGVQVNSHRERYWEQLELRNALSGYFATITIHYQELYKSSNPSASTRYTYEKFQTVFDEFFKLVNNVESHKLNVRRLAKLMDEFSATLISSGAYSSKELSAFWADSDHPNATIKIHSERLKRMGTRTLSKIVADADSAQRGPGRPGTQRPRTDRPVVP